MTFSGSGGIGRLHDHQVYVCSQFDRWKSLAAVYTSNFLFPKVCVFGIQWEVKRCYGHDTKRPDAGRDMYTVGGNFYIISGLYFDWLGGSATARTGLL